MGPHAFHPASASQQLVASLTLPLPLPLCTGLGFSCTLLCVYERSLKTRSPTDAPAM